MSAEVCRPPRAAVVVFADTDGPWWMKLLRPGFRHCFVVVAADSGWVVIEPLLHCTEILTLALPAGADPASWYRAQGYVTVSTWLKSPPRRLAPVRPHTCVEVVKRVLGISSGKILTPWQLFQFLRQEQEKMLDESAGAG